MKIFSIACHGFFLMSVISCTETVSVNTQKVGIKPNTNSPEIMKAIPVSTIETPFYRREVNQAPELGQIQWERNFKAAKTKARKEKKPLLILFDEVPGCSTVLNYGKTVLSHPLIVEAAESYFVPVAVFNNIEGIDRDILESFGEPSWNNPVVRIIDADTKALSPRLAGDYTVAGLAQSMIKSLESFGQTPPGYLQVLLEEQNKSVETAVLAMYCFWSGEVSFGKLDGVIETRTGFLQGREVVEVQFDPEKISYQTILQEAKKANAADWVFARTKEQESMAKSLLGNHVSFVETPIKPSPKDDKYQMRHTPWRSVPMTPLQATRVNTALAAGQDPSQYLSAYQVWLYEKITKTPEADWPVSLGKTELNTAFATVEKTLAQLEN